ncbi:MAG: hypothetical protein ACUVXG_09735, partial [Anaerolineae bacterium]
IRPQGRNNLPNPQFFHILNFEGGQGAFRAPQGAGKALLPPLLPLERGTNLAAFAPSERLCYHASTIA